ncbi:hypothetical protein M2272_005155 [Mycobacterium frederiksbergense]|uniref:Uncharacterized protein n=1 Tax=Mycolicibacterium frederiksbergense TaxID=117567 RepID=A0ABT6L7B2_9MYCO|nr:hypothetical protein [Mycolicibacterium frederiksbergense]
MEAPELSEPSVQGWIEDWVATESRSENVEIWVDQVQAPVLKSNPGVADDAALSHTV